MKSNKREASESFSECNTGWGGAPEPQPPAVEVAGDEQRRDDDFPALEYALTLRSRG
jgi:hypothetical protein